jgi:hypothetical protein
MRLLPDDQYAVWPNLLARIVFAYNTAAHQSLGGVTPFELYYGIVCRDTFSRILTDQVLLLPQPPDEVGDAENARLFALAVKTSVCAFVQFARNHDQYVKDETAALLNQKGSSRTFVIGAMVKARFPPTQAELLATSRRSNHVSAWRGPCRVIDRLPSTTYRLVHVDSEREFERSISNLLPWKAQSRKKARNGQYDETVNAPFAVNEFIAVRDEPSSWFFLAKVTTVKPKFIIVHYYGTRSGNLHLATFSPGWHLTHSAHITLSDLQPTRHLRYSGVLQLDSLSTLLVARNLSMTSASRLTSKSRRVLTPVRDELFIFE